MELFSLVLFTCLGFEITFDSSLYHYQIMCGSFDSNKKILLKNPE